MNQYAKIIADSINPDGDRVTTIEVRYQRFILPEMNTHRAMSRNYSSSRAIPTAKLLGQVLNHTACPIHWGQNRQGMQAVHEVADDKRLEAEWLWQEAAWNAANVASKMANLGVHKQVVNRIIEPFMWVTGIISATEWQNFFDLRCHPDAQPEIQAIACLIREAIEGSVPVERDWCEWHLPYVNDEERKWVPIETAKKVSSARCCRVSYLKHDGSSSSIDEDIALFNRLAGAEPIHASPLEHVAKAQKGGSGNFNGWRQFRKEIESVNFA